MKISNILAFAAGALIWAACGGPAEEVTSRIYKTDSSSELLENESFISSAAEQNTVYISAGTLNATGCSIKKSGNGTSLSGGRNAAILVTGSGWLLMKGGSSVSDAAFAPALAIVGGKAEGAVKLSGCTLSTLGADSPAVYLEKNKLIMDEGQLSTAGDVPAIMVPKGSDARVELSGVLCSCPVLAQVEGTLYLKLGQYAGSETEYAGQIKIAEGGKLILDDPEGIWKGQSFGAGEIQKVF